MFGSPSLHYDHINSFTKYVLIIFYVPGTVLGTRDPTEGKTDKTSAVIFSCRRGGWSGKDSIEVNTIVLMLISAVRKEAGFCGSKSQREHDLDKVNKKYFLIKVTFWELKEKEPGKLTAKSLDNIMKSGHSPGQCGSVGWCIVP